MSWFFNSLFDCVKRRKVYVIILVLFAILAIVLAVFAGLSLTDGVLSIDLDNISYIRYLKGDSSLVSFMFNMIISLLIFFAIILLCHCKSFVFPLAVIFFLYMVYSQAVVFISVIMIFGFFNCLVLILLLFVYILLICFLFICAMAEMMCIINSHDYFKSCFRFNSSKIPIFLILIICVTLVFCFILTILKSFVILLVY